MDSSNTLLDYAFDFLKHVGILFVNPVSKISSIIQYLQQKHPECHSFCWRLRLQSFQGPVDPVPNYQCTDISNFPYSYEKQPKARVNNLPDKRVIILKGKNRGWRPTIILSIRWPYHITYLLYQTILQCENFLRAIKTIKTSSSWIYFKSSEN